MAETWSGDSVSVSDAKVHTVAELESVEIGDSVSKELNGTSKELEDDDCTSEGDSECRFAVCSLQLLESSGDAELDKAVVFLRSQWIGAVNSVSASQHKRHVGQHPRTGAHAAARVDKHRLLRVVGKAKGVLCRVLIDRGATHSVCSLDFARLAGVNLTQAKQEVTTLTSPLGERHDAEVFVDVPIRVTIAGWSFVASFEVTELKGYDLVLGTPWFYDWLPKIDDRENTVLVKEDSRIVRFVADADFEGSPHHFGLNTMTMKMSKKLLKRKMVEGYLVQVKDRDVAGMTSRPLSSKLTVADVRYRGVVEEFADVFPDELPAALPPSRGQEHEINLVPGAVLPKPRGMRLSHAMMQELQRQISRLLELGLIRPSKSPLGAGVFFVKKADGTFRLVCDWRGLNAITVKDATCVPHADDLFDELGASRVFTVLDQWSGFNQVLMKESDVWKTAMKTPLGNFEWLVMGFGLTNAPATFQRLMTTVLRPFLGKFVVAFQDDLVVHSQSHEEHGEHLRQVLQALREAKLYAKPSKCTIGASSVKFLGHIISQGTIATDPDKVAAVNDMEPPQDVHGVRRFLGMANWFRRFVPNFSDLAAPLHSLTKKHADFSWGDAEQAAFVAVKLALLKTPVLRLPDFGKPFTVQTDASERAVGGVLLQQDDESQYYVVAYRSEKLPTLQQAWPTHDRELYAIVAAVTGWRHYLEGKQFVVETDHRPLLHIMTQKDLTNKQIRWVTKLASFDFTLVYRPGAQMGVADCLSRPVEVANLSFRKQCCGEYESDPYFKPVIAGTARFHRQSDGALYLVEEGRPPRLCVPTKKLQQALLTEYHNATFAAHPGRDRMVDALARSYFWRGLAADVGRFVRTCERCQKSKPRNMAPPGAPMPLNPPDFPWQHISIDFMTDLPTTQRGCDMLMVVVDRFSKMAHLTPCKKSNTSEQVAKLMIRDIFRLHGIPQSVVSDRDPRFTSDMWESFWDQLGTTLSMSTADHPQTDGQTEVVNRSINWMLRTVLETQGPAWDELAPLLEFAHNSMKVRPTGLSPFEVVYGRALTLPATMAVPGTQLEATAMTEQLDDVKAKLLQAQALMELSPSITRSTLTFEEGDQVLVAASRVHGGEPQRTNKAKWQELWRGPFIVSKVLSSNAYRLEMPDWFLGHPVFNVEYLKAWHPPPSEAVVTALEEEVGQVEVSSPVAKLAPPQVHPPVTVRRSGRVPKPSWRRRVGGDE